MSRTWPVRPLKGVASNIQIGALGQSPINTDMPNKDSTGRTEKTVDPLPARTAGADVYISVTGTDGNRYNIGTSYVPK